MHETTTLLLVTLPNIHRFKKSFHTLSNKPFLIWLLTTPPHLKYVATLPCNLLLTACFADINVSQGSVATYGRCSGIFNTKESSSQFFLNRRLRFDGIMVMSLFGLPCSESQVEFSVRETYRVFLRICRKY